MNFNDVVEDTINQIQDVLSAKADEYATSNNRYHNFEAAGRKQNCTPEKALLGMMVKHVVAVDDLVNWIELSPHKLNEAMINEKIGDNINYLILLKGMLLNRVEAYKQGTWMNPNKTVILSGPETGTVVDSKTTMMSAKPKT